MMDTSAILISLRTSVLSIILTFFLGVFAAWGVISIRRARLKAVIDSLLTLPLVLPPTVAGFLLLYTFGVNRPVGSFLLDFFGVRVVFNWPATVLAAVVVSFPLMYRSARGAFEQVDRDVLDAARTIGMPEWRFLWRMLFDSDRRINLRPQVRRVGYLFQNHALFPHMTIR